MSDDLSDGDDLSDDESLSVRLAGPWWLWRDMALRAAGFAIDDLLRLGHPALAAVADTDTDTASFRAAYEAAIDESCTVLAELTDHPTFRSALLWQNRPLVDVVLDRFQRSHHARRARNSNQRQREILLSKYLQRYHAKNESIGFFGPVGWARWCDDSSPGAPVLAVTGLHSEIVDRRAQLEVWAVRVLAERFSRDPGTRRALRPVPAPSIKVRDGRVHTALRGWFDMPSPRVDVLAACTGRDTVTQIAERLIGSGVPGIQSVEDVEGQLSGLERAGYVAVDLLVPPTLPADQFLARQLALIPDAATRERHSAVLGGIQAAAGRVRAAAGDHHRLADALCELESRFSEASGADAHRPDAGDRVVGRQLMVEDCRSALSATLRPPLLADLAGPLDLVLSSTRWLVDRVGARYLEILGDIYDAMVRPGRAEVGLAAILSEFWPRCTRDAVATEAAGCVSELQRRWAGILQIPPGVRRHHVAAGGIATLVREQFAAATAPWLSGRVHCPDVMIAASGPESICRGDYTWVLGEMHPATNTLNQSPFMLSHPQPHRAQAMADETAAGGPWLIPIYPSDWPEISSRGYPPPYLISPSLDCLHFTAEPPRDATTGTVVPIADLAVVRGEDGALWLDQDGGGRRHPLALLGEFLTDGLPDVFQPVAPSPHRPRVSIDRLVLTREQWRMAVEDLAWSKIINEPDRYRAARRWANGLGLPRHVFVRVAGERKPFYVDLTSPLLVNMIASALRTTIREQAGSLVTVTEMFPGPDDLWAPHSEGGRRCTSELRMAVVDRPDA